MDIRKQSKCGLIWSLALSILLGFFRPQAYGELKTGNWPIETHQYSVIDPALKLFVVISGSPYESLAEKKIVSFSLNYDPSKVDESPRKNMLLELFGNRREININQYDVYIEKRTYEIAPNKEQGSQLAAAGDTRPNSFIIRFKDNDESKKYKLGIAYLELSDGKLQMIGKDRSDVYLYPLKGFFPVNTKSVNVRAMAPISAKCPGGSCPQVSSYTTLKDGLDNASNFAIAILSDNMRARISWQESEDRSKVFIKQLLIEVGTDYGKNIRYNQQIALVPGISMLSLKQKLRSWLEPKVTTFTLADLASSEIVVGEDRTVVLDVGGNKLVFAVNQNKDLQALWNGQELGPTQFDLRDFGVASILGGAQSVVEFDESQMAKQASEAMSDPEEKFKDYFMARANDRNLIGLNGHDLYKEIREVFLGFYSKEFRLKMDKNEEQGVRITDAYLREQAIELTNDRQSIERDVVAQIIMNRYLPLDESNHGTLQFWFNYKRKKILEQRKVFLSEIKSTQEAISLIAIKYFLLRHMFNAILYGDQPNPDLKQMIEKEVLKQYMESRSSMESGPKMCKEIF